MNDELKVKIGLEIHAYLNTKEKLFCKCSSDYSNFEPNQNICEICTGMPGTKPLPTNEEAIKKTIQIAHILNCKLGKQPFIFQRKHYDWPDMPNGYQRTISGSYSNPVGIEGFFEGIRIIECHLEEDPARWEPSTGRVDYNRAGVPLIEIVTYPDFKNAKEVRNWLDKLLYTLEYLQLIKKGSIKADVNISVNYKGKQGNRVEIKNVNSLKAIEKVINYEILRQKTILMQGRNVERETRAFNEAQGTTIRMRSKEEAVDYRFIPDPDISPIYLSEEFIKKTLKELKEAPLKRIERFMKEFGLSYEEAYTLCTTEFYADLFEELVNKEKGLKDLIVKTMKRDLLKALEVNNKSITDLEKEFNKELFVLIIREFKEGNITNLIFQELLVDLVKGRSKEEIIKKLEENKVVSDEELIKKIVKEVVNNNTKAVEDYKKGQEKAIQFLFGQVMRKLKKRGNKDLIWKYLKEELK
jgi:aspartyl-tRNA(Asn)/glutamyl-tRNA(Gln) amidotransferase subunit B